MSRQMRRQGSSQFSCYTPAAMTSLNVLKFDSEQIARELVALGDRRGSV